MVNKPTALALFLIALFATTAWSVAAIDADAGCAGQADSPDDRWQQDARENAGDGPTRELRFAYDEIFDEGRVR